MAIQKLNLGLPITGEGGDNYREAHTKINANFSSENNAASKTVGPADTDVPLVSNVREMVKNNKRAYPTYAAMVADTNGRRPGTIAEVVADANGAKNGAYKFDGFYYKQIKYEYLSAADANADNLMFAVTDTANNLTWLQANSVDGGPTPAAEDAIRKSVDLTTQESTLLFAFTDRVGNLTDIQLDKNGRVTDTVIREWLKRSEVIDTRISRKPSTLMFAVTDEANNLTDLQLNAAGQVPDTVMVNWHARLKNLDNGALTPDASPTSQWELLKHDKPAIYGSQTTINENDVHLKNGEFLPVLPDINKIILTGSSSADRSKTYIISAFKAIKPQIEVYAPAMAGAVISHQASLVGYDPVKINFVSNVIPATGAVAGATTENLRFDSRMRGVTGWVDGIKGVLLAGGRGTDVTFTRAAQGAPVQVPPDVEFIPEYGNIFRNALQIIWIGKNNLTNTNPVLNDVDKLIRNTNEMIDYNASLVKRVVVMTHFNNTDTPAISDIRNRVDRCNRLYKLHYKQNVFDVEPIILGNQIFIDLGITKTATDIEQIAIGNKPPSLSADAGHCLPVVYEYIANKLASFVNSKNYLG